MAIDPRTRMGAVRLAVADLDGMTDFYERTVGLAALERSGELVKLGVDDALVELAPAPDAPSRPPGTTGLFHLAILVPDRAELGRSLRRVAAAGGGFTGASDHLVSESLYLRDPEGNGIEIYRDRPREEWRWSDGEVEMPTVALDLDGVLVDAAADEGAAPMPAGTRIGHVHLNVADLGATEAFYADALGFDVTVRGFPGALFLSAGGYHHHLGANTWGGEGAPPPPAGSLGLRWFEVVLPDGDSLSAAESRLREAQVAVERGEAGLRVTDPFSNGVLVKGR